MSLGFGSREGESRKVLGVGEGAKREVVHSFGRRRGEGWNSEETRSSLKLSPFEGTEVRRGIVAGVWVDNPLHFRHFVISPVGD